MSLTILIIAVLCLGGGAAVAIAIAVIWMQNRQEDQANRRPEPVDYTPRRAASTQAQQQIRDLMAAGNKIEAIKVYRAETGVGLKEAKDAVEALERGSPLPEIEATPAMPVSADIGVEINNLILEGKKIEAIRRYREATGASLADAKEAVEAIERNEPYQGYYPAGPDLGEPVSPDQESRIRALLQAGDKLEAIKVYREATGADLKTAKDAVEALQKGIG